MKNPRVIDRVPLPKSQTYESWRYWCLRVSDELVDIFQEFQKESLASEALFCAATAVVYKLPSGCLGNIESVTFFDLLLHSMDLLGSETYQILSKKTSSPFCYLPELMLKWKTGLMCARIHLEDWAEATAVDARELRYWVDCGIHIRPCIRAIVEAWVNVKCPWPIPLEFMEYLKSLKKEA